jgi:hypothetical protein
LDRKTARQQKIELFCNLANNFYSQNWTSFEREIRSILIKDGVSWRIQQDYINSLKELEKAKKLKWKNNE